MKSSFFSRFCLIMFTIFLLIIIFTSIHREDVLGLPIKAEVWKSRFTEHGKDRFGHNEISVEVQFTIAEVTSGISGTRPKAAPAGHPVIPPIRPMPPPPPKKICLKNDF
ncbi:uncharacterized protein LOC134236046 [Saccostrea cucullata]|uniref:uncharacterized protein LOC134236046 n=1 Tax=Saccostrea cuccullata TaxID=36930 RepID=UPI002ED11BE7